jgi:hypothetical protein
VTPLTTSPGSGSCSNGPCTWGDYCSNGTCATYQTITCTNDQCNARACNGTSSCSVTPLTGQPCTSANLCQLSQTCQSNGVCGGGTPKTCTASDQCHVAGVCDSSTGSCSNPPAPNGTACTGVPNGLYDSCQNGTCAAQTCVSTYCASNGVCYPTNTQCCSTAECYLASLEGYLSCTNHQCVTPVTCAQGFTACGSTCIPPGACCSNTDCPSGMTCVGNACSLSCPSGYQVCGSACLAVGTQVCCPQDN